MYIGILDPVKPNQKKKKRISQRPVVEPWLSSHLPCDASEWCQFFVLFIFSQWLGVLSQLIKHYFIAVRPGNNIDTPDVVGVDLEYEIFGNFGRFKWWTRPSNSTIFRWISKPCNWNCCGRKGKKCSLAWISLQQSSLASYLSFSRSFL